jgi:PAS domain S-box-containing protein
MDNKTIPHRILIVDDSPEDRELYRRLIGRGSEQDYVFWEAGLAEEGLELYRSENPDCVVLDYQLPDLNGLEFLARLQPELGNDPAPIIMLTGQGNETVAVQALKMGAQDYLVKDRAGDGLKAAVQSVIERMALYRQINERRRELDRSVAALRASEEQYWLSGARALREIEERHRLLLEGVTDYAIVMDDTDGRVVSWNGGAERLFGYRAAEIVGKHISCFFSTEDVQQGYPQRELQVAALEGHHVNEGWRVRKDGSRFRAHVTVTPLRDGSGILWGFAKVMRGISERTQAGSQ